MESLFICRQFCEIEDSCDYGWHTVDVLNGESAVKDGGWSDILEISFDNGKTFKPVSEYAEMENRVCANCEFLRDGAGFDDPCVNEKLNKQIDPDEQLDSWFVPFIGYGCTEFQRKQE